MQKLELKDVQSHIFSGGEIHVQLTPEQLNANYLEAGIIKNANDLMKLILVIDALDNDLTVHIPYLPYARQDRACAPGQCFSLKVICKMLDNGNHYIFDDVHNPKAIRFENSTFGNKLIPFVNDLSQYSAIISPDEGAVGRASFQSRNEIPVIVASKKRNPENGWITGYQVDLSGISGKVLVVDDICDGGKTFEILGEEIQKHGLEADLWVTHGIFSKGKTDLLKYYKSINAVHDWVK